MSTIVVVKKDGVVAIAADTLTTYGGTKESAEYIVNSSKLLRVGETVLSTVGHASWRTVLSSYLSAQAEPPALDSVEAIFEWVRGMHGVLKEDYFLKLNGDEDDDFERTHLCSLIANPSGIFGIYTMRSVQEYRKFYAFGSGMEYALGAMHAVYDTAASAEAVARAGVEAGAAFDDGSGLPLEVITIPLKSA
ncbi:MAG TPA: hypothetical protein VK689_02240 [Armatimonadota bacterium]|nr:hypothetical protein [Armatimonadota bacterium]